jgi:inorganic pyrophosphatase
MDYATKFLGKKVTVKVDRPLGSKHPEFKITYPVNYGFIPKTKAPDGEEIDSYLLGIDKPIKEFTGKCIAIIHRLDDEDNKLVVVPENINLTDEEIIKLTHFQEKFFKIKVIRK